MTSRISNACNLGPEQLRERLAQLERALIDGAGHANAKEFTRRILAMAERYPEEAAHTPPETREQHFSAAQRLAWSLRFERDPEALQGILDGIGEMVRQ